ncbi:MAG: MFS transporter [Firmicutes bacterium]|nr:MFS transporter [Bacillota bacterium]
MLLQFAIQGLLTNSFQVFQPRMLEEFNLSATQLSTMIEIRIIVSVLCMIFVVQYHERIGFKKGMTLAALITAVAFGMFFIAKNYMMLCVAYVFAGAGYTLGGTTPTASLMMRWFSDNRGLAVGITSAGSGLANVICSPLFAHLLESHSLQFCFMVQVCMLLFFGTLAFFIIDVPENKYGVSIESEGEGVPGNEKASIHPRRKPGKGGSLALIMASFLAGGFTGTSFAYLTNVFVDSCNKETQVALALSIFGGMLIVSKFTYGWISDRLGAYRTNYIFYACGIAGLAVCTFIPGSTVMMFASVFLMGIGFCILNVGLPVWAYDFSDASSYPKTMRNLQTASIIGTLIFNISVGPSVDFSGSYRMIFGVFVGVGILSLVLIQGLYVRMSIRGKR